MDTKTLLNNKRLIVFSFCVISVALTFIGLAIFSLFTLNKFVGVGTGTGIVVICGVIALTVKKTSYMPVIIANALAVGIAISSMYTHLGFFPPVWQLALIAFGTAALFGIFCLFTKTPLFEKHHIVCGIVYLLIVLTAEILLTVFVSPYVFAFALFLFMTLAAHVLTLSARAKDLNMLIHNLTVCSFTVLLLAVLIVIAIITEGDGAEAVAELFTASDGSKTNKTKPFDPYNFELLK
ncbi:MAG: hypothetical protein ACI4QN_06450 [Candidatus Coproplasma sp.]